MDQGCVWLEQSNVLSSRKDTSPTRSGNFFSLPMFHQWTVVTTEHSVEEYILGLYCITRLDEF